MKKVSVADVSLNRGLWGCHSLSREWMAWPLGQSWLTECRLHVLAVVLAGQAVLRASKWLAAVGVCVWACEAGCVGDIALALAARAKPHTHVPTLEQGAVSHGF